MAASYLGKHTDEYNGLILLAAYSTADLSDSDLKVLSLYGSNDGVLSMEKYEEKKEFFDTIKRRKSIRSFTDEPVSRKELEQILMAANAALVGSANYENLRISVLENQEITICFLNYLLSKKLQSCMATPSGMISKPKR